MEVFSRTDVSLFGRWWWTVDRWTIGAVLGLMLAGVILILAGSPAVAEKNNYDSRLYKLGKKTNSVLEKKLGLSEH